jgi:hypothetical protein
MMSRSLHVLFRRDPSRDRQENQIPFEGYRFFWPDGRPVAVGFDAFCKHGQWLFRLGNCLGRCRERLIEIICFPLQGLEDKLNRLPGGRVRRFFVERHGRQGRVYFMDGTPTAIVMDLDQDEASVLQWIGLAGLPDGERQWFDLAARAVELPPRSVPCRCQATAPRWRPRLDGPSFRSPVPG